MKKIISTSDAPAAIGPYSQAIRFGNFEFCSGQIVSDDVGAQTRRVLDDVSAVLKSEGISLNDVLKTTIFLTDLGNFQIVNESTALISTTSRQLAPLCRSRHCRKERRSRSK